ncbi:MAG: class II glutamine amidotransferase [Solirubrobacteraceae bacterium]
MIPATRWLSREEATIIADLERHGLQVTQLRDVLRGGHVLIDDPELYTSWQFAKVSHPRISSHHHDIDKKLYPDYGMRGYVVREKLHGRTQHGTWMQLEKTPAAFGAKKLPSLDDLKHLADYVESVSGAEVLSAGSALEIVKDLGDAQTVGGQYKLDSYIGTHGIGHVRMATESDVDISNAHPYWAYPFSDVAVVHNGQLTNYHQWRRRLERMGHRFASDCDSEIIAVYLAQRMSDGASLEDAMRMSLEDLDGVFTYICVSDDALGMAKDELAAKPLVLYEGDDMVVMASEEMAIRAVIDREIETYDPYESEVMVWTR